MKEPWNQEWFEELLIRWIITSDQPFEEMEHCELTDLLNYVHHKGTPLKIPGHFTVKHRVMNMGAEQMKEIKKLFAVHHAC